MSGPAKRVVAVREQNVPLSAMVPVLVGLIFLTGSLTAIVLRGVRKRRYEECWHGYDDCGWG